MEPKSEVNLVDNAASIDLCTDVCTANNVVTTDSDSFHGGRMGKLRKAMDKTTEHCLSLLWSVFIARAPYIRRRHVELRTICFNITSCIICSPKYRIIAGTSD